MCKFQPFPQQIFVEWTPMASFHILKDVNIVKSKSAAGQFLCAKLAHRTTR